MSEFAQVAQKYAHPEVVDYWQQFNRNGLQAAEAYFIDRYFKPTCPLLDLGCGAGRVAVALQPIYTVYGMDLTFELMQAGNRDLSEREATALQPTFWQANMLSLPLPAQSFRCVLCLYATIQHVPGQSRRQQAFREMARVMQPEGVLIAGIDNLAPALRCYAWWIQRKLLRQERVPLGISQQTDRENTAVSPPSSSTNHLTGIAHSLQWRTTQPFINLSHRMRTQKLETGDRFIDRVSSSSTSGHIRYHVYQHQTLLADAAQAGFVLDAYISNREVAENQQFPETIRQREHQILYAFRLNP